MLTRCSATVNPVSAGRAQGSSEHHRDVAIRDRGRRKEPELDGLSVLGHLRAHARAVEESIIEQEGVSRLESWAGHRALRRQFIE